MHRTVPSGVDISAEYMFDYRQQDDSPITRFMHGKCVLITGATGFLGSLFLEKCLRVGAGRVYVLCRAKGGKTPQQRIEELLDAPVSVMFCEPAIAYLISVYAKHCFDSFTILIQIDKTSLYKSYDVTISK